ncbi:MAG: TIGR02186 family protein, partial [Rhodospirillaceae bacterium]
MRWMVAAVTFLCWAIPARAQDVPLVADLSNHLVAITTGFTGTDVLLFGATDGPGDIAVVVRGPAGDAVVRRKERFGPIWVSGTTVTLRDVPSYYRVASSRPLEDVAPQLLLSRFQIGLNNIRAVPAEEISDPNLAREFREALIRLKVDDELYDQGVGEINLMSNRLFRTE